MINRKDDQGYPIPFPRETCVQCGKPLTGLQRITCSKACQSERQSDIRHARVQAARSRAACHICREPIPVGGERGRLPRCKRCLPYLRELVTAEKLDAYLATMAERGLDHHPDVIQLAEQAIAYRDRLNERNRIYRQNRTTTPTTPPPHPNPRQLRLPLP